MKSAVLPMFLLAAGLVFAANKPIGKPKFIPVQFPGATATNVFAISNTGVMVGMYRDSQNAEKGFAISGQNTVTITFPGAVTTSCQGVNSGGAIVGDYFTTNENGFLYQNGNFTTLNPSGGSAQALGINDAGIVVGGYTETLGGQSHGFVWDGSKYQTIDVPGSTGTLATGINNQGLIALEWFDSNNQVHASVYDGTTFHSVPDVQGAVDTFPGNINDYNDIALTWDNGGTGEFAAVYHAGADYKFMVPGSTQSAAFGINNQRVIAGYFLKSGQNNAIGLKLIP